MAPPIFDPAPGFPEARALFAALRTALERARPPKAVCLSTIGAQASQPNLLNQLGLMEQQLGALPLPIAFCVLDGSWRIRHGHCAGAGDRRHPEFPSAPRQARADGRDGRCRSPRRRAASGDMDRQADYRTRRAAPHRAGRDRDALLKGPRPRGANGSRPSRDLGGFVYDAKG
ncbi:protein of unknown function (plasmid) [Methylocella tundrae]|uniref:Uncharacterized protein n=1 Tax=Methylocella tundrae TaxID=227605 RepID=A0A4U8Z701_METTU|nr:protein of unknown function [Methylocella tundrae]